MEVFLVDVSNEECLNGVYKPTREDPELLVVLSWDLYPKTPTVAPLLADCTSCQLLTVKPRSSQREYEEL